jgi:hypothetical protein
VRTSRSPWRPVIALALSAVLATGCGSESPAEADPELAQELTRVDRAVVTGDDALIRDRVESLVSATEAARDAGRLDEEQADRIIAAADGLLARVPAPEPAPRPSATPSPSATLSPSPEDEGEGEGEGEGEPEEKEEPKPKPEDKHDHHEPKGHQGH